jgi:hypothetical protein
MNTNAICEPPSVAFFLSAFVTVVLAFFPAVFLALDHLTRPLRPSGRA